MNDKSDDEDFEELYGKWNPSLYAAAMIDEHRFAMLVGGPRWDDPYTIILTHDDRHEQPWSRFDVRREIQQIRVAALAEQTEFGSSYVALSLSGDIYHIGQSSLKQLTIPDTQTEDPEGEATYLHGFAWTGSEYVVAGDDGFLKAGRDRSWQDVSPEIPAQFPYGKPTWRIPGTDIAGRIYIAAYQKADPRHFNFYSGHPQYRDDLSDEERWELKKKLRRQQDSYPQLVHLFAGKPGEWKHVVLPERIVRSFPAYSYISDITDTGTPELYITGSDGLVIKGNPIDGFRDLSSIVDREINVSSATLYRNELVVGADRQLLRFDGHLFKPFVPKVKVSKAPFIIQPSATFSLNENLYLFDFSLRWRVFDGVEWREYSLPSELVARPFPGLPPRR